MCAVPFVHRLLTRSNLRVVSVSSQKFLVSVCGAVYCAIHKSNKSFCWVSADRACKSLALLRINLTCLALKLLYYYTPTATQAKVFKTT